MPTPRSNRAPALTTAYLLTLGLLLLAAPAMGATYAFGSFVDEADADYVPAAGAEDVVLCTVDDDASGTYTPGEPLYLLVEETACGPVMADDLRLIGLVDETAGSEVGATDPDFGLPTTAIPHALRFVDNDGDANFDSDDTLYLDLSSLAGMQVTPGDLRLTGYVEQAPATLPGR